MKIQPYSPNVPSWVKYLMLVITGLLIMLLCSLFQRVQSSPDNDYYWSAFFMKNFTLPAKILFFITGFLAGYFYRLNPWLSGICLILTLPLTSIIEAVVYPGSHNLIPIEFAFHLWLALPAVAAVYIGRFAFKQIKSRRQIKDNVHL